ncbi:MAG: response regulator transcription factor [Microcoleus sp. PH2017_40_RAT_O_B]|uniref:response regulator transcription factor n=1 Tax=unclassified Microcoleus TaxID=2642155 RepID=UPI001D56345E|nr:MULTISPECIES: response regulator transcription factor [unclassified Microcoleus]TAE56735.1 MAG: DNA-binding response regulator [Oscillatoriales cyanobacterium]MCC3435300.1 response regulator transcription factor [Microcoleus sp. PH2017_05_CCC_O_A]MCC3454328.1 response regulator transcription factor [Microcoleus sp. PH2017_08_TRC_O_A]MCC3471014.1 response regulator transcription factor [Microcoleus sp. PH2017_13_LAR_U_A]MCC3483695.1 response regulator transcription factor [Microcoleus sp. PH
MKILLVEDDYRIAQALAEALTDQHYAVDIAADGQEGWNFAETFTYDLILLDVMLPKIDGITLCQGLRRQGLKTPVLMLTARDTSNDKVIGLDAGADDYVVKPFDLPELAARIRALLRRGSTTLPPVLEWENLRLNPNTCEVTYRDNLLNFTPKEYSLLELFLRTGGRVLTRSAILDHIWAFEDSPGEETVKVHLRGLRQKLKAAGAPANFIETIYGMGYRLNQNL